jgi:hypothetical protein
MLQDDPLVQTTSQCGHHFMPLDTRADWSQMAHLLFLSICNSLDSILSRLQVGTWSNGCRRCASRSSRCIGNGHTTAMSTERDNNDAWSPVVRRMDSQHNAPGLLTMWGNLDAGDRVGARSVFHGPAGRLRAVSRVMAAVEAARLTPDLVEMGSLVPPTSCTTQLGHNEG